MSLSSFCINISELIHWPLDLNHWGKCFRPDRKLIRHIITSFATQRGENADEQFLCNSFAHYRNGCINDLKNTSQQPLFTFK